jgi:PRC-barrel domain
MRVHYRAAAAMTLVVFCAAIVYSAAQENPSVQPKTERPSDESGKTPAEPSREPTMTVLDHRDVQGVLGKEVRSAADENMGRVVDVIVDQTGRVRAAIIDFGGFLGVGSRKIAVAWNALRFPVNTKKGEHVALELTRDQVRAAPEYKQDKPVVVLGASGSLESLPFP